MITLVQPSFRETYNHLGRLLLYAPEQRVPEWQSMDVKDKPMGITHELQNAIFEIPISGTQRELEVSIPTGNYPWAENHFQERVSGIPHNPPPSAAEWPFAQAGHAEHTKGEKFSHTYPERFWPKDVETHQLSVSSKEYGHYERRDGRPVMINGGIRYALGDLADVVKQLAKSPQTRQAYLPVFFPEDTGAVPGERVPCTLGYHFLIRYNRLNVTYFIRSVDFLRHFSDDVYMAARLGQWVKTQVNDCIAKGWTESTGEHEDSIPIDPISMGNLTMHMVSLHVFGGDMPRMEREFHESTR